MDHLLQIAIMISSSETVKNIHTNDYIFGNPILKVPSPTVSECIDVVLWLQIIGSIYWL